MVTRTLGTLGMLGMLGMCHERSGRDPGMVWDEVLHILSVPESLRIMVLCIRYGILDDTGNTMDEIDQRCWNRMEELR